MVASTAPCALIWRREQCINLWAYQVHTWLRALRLLGIARTRWIWAECSGASNAA